LPDITFAPTHLFLLLTCLSCFRHVPCFHRRR
jgi:hypothetical protein